MEPFDLDNFHEFIANEIRHFSSVLSARPFTTGTKDMIALLRKKESNLKLIENFQTELRDTSEALQELFQTLPDESQSQLNLFGIISNPRSLDDEKSAEFKFIQSLSPKPRDADKIRTRIQDIRKAFITELKKTTTERNGGRKANSKDVFRAWQNTLVGIPGMVRNPLVLLFVVWFVFLVSRMLFERTAKANQVVIKELTTMDKTTIVLKGVKDSVVNATTNVLKDAYTWDSEEMSPLEQDWLGELVEKAKQREVIEEEKTREKKFQELRANIYKELHMGHFLLLYPNPVSDELEEKFWKEATVRANAQLEAKNIDNADEDYGEASGNEFWHTLNPDNFTTPNYMNTTKRMISNWYYATKKTFGDAILNIRNGSTEIPLLSDVTDVAMGKKVALSWVPPSTLTDLSVYTKPYIRKIMQWMVNKTDSTISSFGIEIMNIKSDTPFVEIYPGVRIAPDTINDITQNDWDAILCFPGTTGCAKAQVDTIRKIFLMNERNVKQHESFISTWTGVQDWVTHAYFLKAIEYAETFYTDGLGLFATFIESVYGAITSMGYTAPLVAFMGGIVKYLVDTAWTQISTLLASAAASQADFLWVYIIEQYISTLYLLGISQVCQRYFVNDDKLKKLMESTDWILKLWREFNITMAVLHLSAFQMVLKTAGIACTGGAMRIAFGLGGMVGGLGGMVGQSAFGGKSRRSKAMVVHDRRRSNGAMVVYDDKGNKFYMVDSETQQNVSLFWSLLTKFIYSWVDFSLIHKSVIKEQTWNMMYIFPLALNATKDIFSGASAPNPPRKQKAEATGPALRF